MDDARLIPIGRFALLTGLPLSTLRFYDQQGLLQPLRVDPHSRYRLYGLEQLDVAVAIRVLREIDVPLSEIKAVLDNGPEEVERLLRRHRLRILQRQSELERTVSRLDGLLAGGRFVLGHDVEVLELRPLRVVSRRSAAKAADIDATIADLLNALRDCIGTYAALPESPREIVLYHDILRRDGLVEVEVCLPLSAGSAATKDSWELPGGMAARTVHYGPWDDIFLAYAGLFSWILRAGYETRGPLREVYTIDERDTPTPVQYVTELTWLVAGSGRALGAGRIP
jgi:DNA-binding transcriptional MerR regulator